MFFLITCKFKMDRNNSNREKVETSIFRRSKLMIWPKFELIRSFMLQASKGSDRKQFIKSGDIIFPIISLLQTLKGSKLCSRWLDLSQCRIRDFMHVLVTCKYKKARMKNNREKLVPKFCNDLPQSLMQPFPLHNDVSDQDWPIDFGDIEVQK